MQPSMLGLAMVSAVALLAAPQAEAVTLSNGNGITARIIALGAAIQSLVMPDRNG